MWNSTTAQPSQANSTTVTNDQNKEPNSQEDEEEEEEEEEEVMQEPTSTFQARYYADTDSSNDTGTESLTWISWFCSLSGHEYFAEVAEDFIEDDFNLTGLNSMVPFYKEALEMILDVEPEEENSKVPDVSIVENSAELLYGLIHQRFVITRQGLQQMVEKYEAQNFGTCPRYYCLQTPVVPCGRSDMPGLETVKLFCPNCLDLYTPPSTRYHSIDGAYFGTTLPHLLFQQYPDLLPRNTPIIYEPKIFGFRVNERSRSGPRMQWLRMRQVENDGNVDVGDSDAEGEGGGGGGGGDDDDDDDDDDGNKQDPTLFKEGAGENNGATQRNSREGSFGQDRSHNTDISNEARNGGEVQEDVDATKELGNKLLSKPSSLLLDKTWASNEVNQLKESISASQEKSFMMAPLAKLITSLTSPTSPTSLPSPAESTLSLTSVSTTDINSTTPIISPSSPTLSSSSSSLKSLLEKLPTNGYLSGNSFGAYASYFSQGEKSLPNSTEDGIKSRTVNSVMVKEGEVITAGPQRKLGLASVTEIGRDFFDKWTTGTTTTSNTKTSNTPMTSPAKIATREIL